MLSGFFVAGCEREGPAKATRPKSSEPSKAIISETLPSQVSSKETDGIIFKKGPKQRYSQIIVLPEQPHPVGDKLRQELGGMTPNEPAFRTKLASLWAENLAQLSNKPLPSATEPSVRSGARLPQELVGIIHGDKSNISPSPIQALLNGLSVAAAVTHAELLSQFTAERANVLPPTEADVAIFNALIVGIKELGPSQSNSDFESWEQLADAPNPICRLLALRAAVHTTSRSAAGLSSEDSSYTRVDGAAKLGFYLRYLNQSDPVILSSAIEALATVPLAEAREAIESFRLSQAARGETTLMQVASDALLTQKLIMQSEPGGANQGAVKASMPK